MNDLVSELYTYLPQGDVERILAAYEFSAAAHEGQTRKSGEPYVSHPVAVARILAGMHLDAGTLMAALLHDVIEDTPTAREQIASLFGEEVAALVDGVSKLDQIQFKSRAEAQAESFRKMLLAMVEDIRVILVKLADRLHNMRTLGAMPAEKQRRIARETLDIYAPIANRLGINKMRLELEDLGFRSLYPYRYAVIQRALRRATGNQKSFLKKIAVRLDDALSEAGIEARIFSREKHLFSIYRKMRDKGKALADIVDVYGFRLIVDDIDTCYRVLGIVHRLYKPMPGRFKDYIAIPRVNGYQSLHTTLFGPNGVPLEAQIRTHDMDRVAEDGIASHWQYKAVDQQIYAPQARAREWLSSLMEMQETVNSEEFLESVRVDLFPDKVYVFTPKGDILRLPRGATAVDFAYAVHTDVGNRCVAVKVDRRLVPLRTALRNGQTVEIITARGAQPNPNWVNFVATAKARAAIRQHLKNLQRGEAGELGKRLLDQALGEFGTTVRKLPRERLQATLDELGLNNTAELYEQLGLGERLAPLVARMVAGRSGEAAADGETGWPEGRGPRPLAIAGTEGMVVSYARCCYPIPGDEVMGHLSAGRGVVIHRNSCGNLAEFRKQPNKWIPVTWKKNVSGDFNVEVIVDVINRVGVLAAVASNIASTRTNIEHVSVMEREGDVSALVFMLQVADRVHLARVIRSIRSMPDVLKVSRSAGRTRKSRGLTASDELE
ncbi:MAG: bifunctional (p)ppGpp synthetase/guanosine-3',5'-bis(diphosphate) 3'-pyrophosphohydrolase [Gammaproteobacteria bacterium]|nr:MAG: bifunctional (p)ppGpp synthetase/guanosine-3',5'-bis(diphosphate) 3'-pyrophosphohydrolase [Gammaproteobacteria bacterium]